MYSCFIFSLWPQYVKDRIKNTYAYLAGSLILTAGSAMYVFNTPTLLNLVARNGWMVSRNSVSFTANLTYIIGNNYQKL